MAYLISGIVSGFWNRGKYESAKYSAGGFWMCWPSFLGPQTQGNSDTGQSEK